jgi:propanediol dehydratase large subunit
LSKYKQEKKKMDGFTWKDNSKVMFDKVVASSPFFVRAMTRNAVVKGLASRGCGEVSEQQMFDVCKEVTPSPFLERTLKILEENRVSDAHR